MSRCQNALKLTLKCRNQAFEIRGNAATLFPEKISKSQKKSLQLKINNNKLK